MKSGCSECTCSCTLIFTESFYLWTPAVSTLFNENFNCDAHFVLKVILSFMSELENTARKLDMTAVKRIFLPE